MTAIRTTLLALCCALLVACSPAPAKPAPVTSATAPAADARTPSAALTHIVISTSVTANNLPESETNQKVRGMDIGKLIDPSFVESALSRGLDN